MISSYAFKALQGVEKFSPKPYKEPNGSFSVGWGHNILPHEGYLMKGVTEDVASKLFLQDLYSVEQDLDRFVKIPLNQQERDALIMGMYNLGLTRILKSGFFNYLNGKDLIKAKEAWLSMDKGLPSIKRRREMEWNLFTNGKYAL